MTVADMKRVMVHLRRCDAGLDRPRPPAPAMLEKHEDAELRMLRRLVLALADRVAIQAELLTRAAERRPLDARRST